MNYIMNINILMKKKQNEEKEKENKILKTKHFKKMDIFTCYKILGEGCFQLWQGEIERI